MGLTEGKSTTKANSNPNDSNSNPNANPNSAAELNNSSADFAQTTNATDSPQSQTVVPTAPKTAFAKWESRDEKGNRAKLYWLAAEKCFVLVQTNGNKFDYFYHYSQKVEIKDAFAMPSTKTIFQPQDAPADIEIAYKMTPFQQLIAAQSQTEQSNAENNEKAILDNTNSYLKPLKDWFKVADNSPQNMAMPVQFDAKDQELKATELYAKPDKDSKVIAAKLQKENPKENRFYIVFVNNDTKKKEDADLKISKKGQELIRKAAQEIYDGNGLPVKVIILETSRGFTPNEYQLMGNKDRITYIANEAITNDSDLAQDWAGNGGVTLLEEHCRENPEKGRVHPGFFPANKLFQIAPDVNDVDPKLAKKYQSTMKEFGLSGGTLGGYDAAFWFARNAIHEGGGHGILGSGHTEDNYPKTVKNEEDFKKKIGDKTSYESMMKGIVRGQLYPRDRAMKGSIPEAAQFSPPELERMKQFYGVSETKTIPHSIIDTKVYDAPESY